MAKEFSVDVPVPKSERHFSFWEMAATWTGANANTGVWYTGGVIAALGLGTALAVTIISNTLAYLVVALIGYMGYKVGTTSMGLTRPAFGVLGSKLPSILNATNYLGWCSVTTFIAAIGMSYLFKSVFGWPAYMEPGSWWVMLIGIFILLGMTLGIVLIGGSTSIRKAENVMVVLLVLLTMWETVVILRTVSFADILAWRPALHETVSIGWAIDAQIAYSITWALGVAEFTRFTKTKAAATGAPFLGAMFSMLWFAVVGIVSAIAAAVVSGTFNPSASDPSSVAVSLGLGPVALLIIILTTVTTNVIDIYVGGYSLTNIFPKLKPQKAFKIVALLVTPVVITPLIVGDFYTTFSVFLDYMIMVFCPLLSIVLVDFYFLRKRNYDWDPSNMVKGGEYWYKSGTNWYTIAVLIIGTLVYLIFKMTHIFDSSVGIAFPSMIVTAVIYYIVGNIAYKKYGTIKPNAESSKVSA